MAEWRTIRIRPGAEYPETDSDRRPLYKDHHFETWEGARDRAIELANAWLELETRELVQHEQAAERTRAAIADAAKELSRALDDAAVVEEPDDPPICNRGQAVDA